MIFRGTRGPGGAPKTNLGALAGGESTSTIYKGPTYANDFCERSSD
jgi:hypothetical protein